MDRDGVEILVSYMQSVMAKMIYETLSREGLLSDDQAPFCHRDAVELEYQAYEQSYFDMLDSLDG